jgi:hypothetical protein
LFLALWIPVITSIDSLASVDNTKTLCLMRDALPREFARFTILQWDLLMSCLETIDTDGIDKLLNKQSPYNRRILYTTFVPHRRSRFEKIRMRNGEKNRDGEVKSEGEVCVEDHTQNCVSTQDKSSFPRRRLMKSKYQELFLRCPELFIPGDRIMILVLISAAPINL